jgi:hypothetical protein
LSSPLLLLLRPVATLSQLPETHPRP